MIPTTSTRVADWRSLKLNHRTQAGQASGCAGDVRPQFRHAVERGLREQLPGPPGELLATAVGFLPRHAFERRILRRLRDQDSAVALYTLLTGTANGDTMRLIRSVMVSSALLGDADAVTQWSQAGLTRCRQLTGQWPATAAEWEWVLMNRGYYVALVQDLARFLNAK